MDSRNPVVLALAIIGALALLFLLGMWLTHGTTGGMMSGGGMMGGGIWPLGILVVVGIVLLLVLLTRRA